MVRFFLARSRFHFSFFKLANQRELVTDLIVKAKQIEYLIQSLPEPEAEEEQVR